RIEGSGEHRPRKDGRADAVEHSDRSGQQRKHVDRIGAVIEPAVSIHDKSFINVEPERRKLRNYVRRLPSIDEIDAAYGFSQTHHSRIAATQRAISVVIDGEPRAGTPILQH